MDFCYHKAASATTTSLYGNKVCVPGTWRNKHRRNTHLKKYMVRINSLFAMSDEVIAI